MVTSRQSTRNPSAHQRRPEGGMESSGVHMASASRHATTLHTHSANTPNLAIDNEELTRYATDEPKPARLLLGSRSKWHVMSAPVHQSWATCHPPPRTGHNIARTCMNDTRRVHLHIHTDVRAHTNTHTHTHASLRRTYGH